MENYDLLNSTDIEEAIISTIFKNSNNLLDCIGYINAADFTSERATLYNLIETMYRENKKIDLLTVLEEVKQQGLTTKCPLSYVMNISNVLSSGEALKSYISLLKEKSSRRKFRVIAGQMVKQSLEPGQKISELSISFAEKLMDITSIGKSNCKEITTIADKVKSVLEIAQRGEFLDESIKTDYKNLDNILGGMEKGNLVIIGGRPSMGKTTLAINIASNIAFMGSVMVFSLEMKDSQLVKKILSSKTQVEISKFKGGKPTENDLTKVNGFIDTLKDYNLAIDDSSSLTVAEFRAKCKKRKIMKGLDVVLIDYLQLMSGGRKFENRMQEVSYISRAIKQVAKDLNLLIIAVSQLSRATESMKDKRPKLSDLRESGQIEQDADVVMLVYRDEYYNKKTKQPGIAETIIAKNREGSVGTAYLGWSGKYQKFFDIDS